MALMKKDLYQRDTGFFMPLLHSGHRNLKRINVFKIKQIKLNQMKLDIAQNQKGKPFGAWDALLST